jgi:signal transduction histidine kinase
MSRVLFVDDEPNVLAGLKRMLHGEEPEFECVGVTSAAAALEQTARGDVDVVISDIRMPGMDGIDLLIMLTGHADADARRLALQLGAYDFLNKPADPHELTARLRNALRLKSYEDQLRSQNDTLERQVFELQKLEVIGVLASGVAHDLNNMLGSISGHTELAALGLEDSTPARGHLQLVLDSVDHATKLVQQILTLGRRPELARQVCDLGVIVDDCLKLLGVSVTGNVRIDRVNSGEESRVLADPTQIRQVVMNICINAIQAMDGEGTLRITMEAQELDVVEAAQRGDILQGRYYRLSIADTGHGMDAATLTRIFEPFFTTKGPGRGTGLGLPVADKIVRNHGGRITVESVPGAGTTFHIYLPMRSPAGQAAAQGHGGSDYARDETYSLR